MNSVSQINTQNWAWNIAVLISFILLIYLPAHETLIAKEQSSNYLELFLLLPSGVFYTLLVTLLGSASAIIVGFLVGLGKISNNSFIRVSVSLYTEV